ASKNKDKVKRTNEMAASFDENTKAVADPNAAVRGEKIKKETIESGKFKTAIEKVNEKVSKSNPLQMSISAACAVYNVARITTATVKAKYIFDLVNFSFPFIQAASQIYYYGSVEPELVEYLGDRLTWYDKNETQADGKKNPKYGLTAMDSQGLQMAIYGDFTKLKDFTAQYTTGALGATIMVSSIISSIQNMVGGKENLHNICVTNSNIGLASSVFCLSNPLSAVVCGGSTIAAMFIAPIVANEAVKQLSEPAIKFIADANLTSSLKGVDAGNALAAGVGLMLMKSSMGYGLSMASSVDDVTKFISATDNEYYQYGEELARYEAKSTPFDINNQYSFIGQIASAFNSYRSSDGTIFSQLLNGFSTISSPLTKLSTASALYSQPSNMTLEDGSAENRLNKQVVDSSGKVTSTARDSDLEQIGAVNDWSGRPVYITNNAVLKAMNDQATGKNTAVADTVDYMVSNEYIKDDGAVNTEKTDNKYQKFKDYCTEDRIDPPGTSSESILEGNADDQNWHDGEKCVYKKDRKTDEQTMLNNFAIYYNMCEAQYPTAESSIGGEEVTSCSESKTTTPKSANGDACSLLNNPNIIYVNDGTKRGLKEICETGHSINSCNDANYTLDQELMNIITTLSGKYKVWLNNFGFKYDRYSCGGGQHPKGKAVDLNGIEKLDGSGRAGGPDWGGITYSDPNQVAVINSYASDWLSGIDHSHGGVGQKGCSNSFNPVFPAASTNVNGAAFFADSCDHLHIDVRDRGGQSVL
ncbi:MAG: hypothetical protein WAW80_04990, partial [Candidatus Saccharimonadales bacterium]